MPPAAPVGRRRFLAGAGAAALGTVAGGLAPDRAAAALGATGASRGGTDELAHGVGSFDPTHDRVLLWTAVTPADPAAGPVAVRWEVVGPDGSIHGAGSVEAGPATGWTAVVDVEDLEPATTYGYRWTLASGPVLEGRTRTLPAPGQATERVRLGVASCSRFAAGGFAAYRALAERELDLVVHLGDYVYEDGAAGARPHDPPERLVDLDGYRARYAQHRADPDLQALHARHPVVVIWDDHELAGNAWRDGAAAHDEARDGPWRDRVAAAVQAHHEWLPIRLTDPGEPARIWRSVRLGDLADLTCLDTRLWGRTQQATTGAELADPARTLLGADQAAWLVDRLTAGRSGGARWQVVANQVMVHELRVPVLGERMAELIGGAGFLVEGGTAINADQWDGYPADRARLLDAIGDGGDVVVLTGDVHSSWAWTLPSPGGGPPGAVELVAPAISSTSFAEIFPVDPGLVEVGLRALGGDLAYLELAAHGYLLVDLTHERVHAEWWHVGRDDIASHRLGAARSATWGAPMRLVAEDAPAPEPAPVPAPSTTTPSTEDGPSPGEGLGDDRSGDDRGGSEGGVPAALVGGVAAAVAALAGVIALRRRAGG